MTYYAVLGVPENADSDAIHNAYRTRARQYHPDAGEGSSAGKFREVAEAYDTLSDTGRRQAYDAQLARERTVPREHVVVEPLAQPWFAQRAPGFTARPIPFPGDSFEQTMRAFEEIISDLWFDRW